MKVGTDGVLLGTWCNALHKKNILDIGSGSGLISLILAQRTQSLITAIDIDKGAYEQTVENFGNSKWASNLRAMNLSLDEFYKTQTHQFDLIVCNPPFFTNSLKSEDTSKNNARHNDALPLDLLLLKSKNLLTSNGILSVILPIAEANYCIEKALLEKMYLVRETTVYPTPQKESKRKMLEFSKVEHTSPIKDKLIIELSRHNYTQEYIELTKEFYLNM